MNLSLILLHQESAALQEQKLLDYRDKGTRALFKRHSFCIEISPDDNRLDAFLAEPYIKLGNGNDVGHSSGVLRICLRDAKVIYHTNKPSLKVNNSLLIDLNKAVLTYSTVYNNTNYLILDAINAYLTDLSAMINVPYIPINTVDFTQAYNIRNYGGDVRL